MPLRQSFQAKVLRKVYIYFCPFKKNIFFILSGYHFLSQLYKRHTYNLGPYFSHNCLNKEPWRFSPGRLLTGWQTDLRTDILTVCTKNLFIGRGRAYVLLDELGYAVKMHSYNASDTIIIIVSEALMSLTIIVRGYTEERVANFCSYAVFGLMLDSMINVKTCCITTHFLKKKNFFTSV